MKRLISILLSITLVATTVCGQKIQAKFSKEPMTDVLRKLNEMSGDYTINFIYNQLEDINVTANIKAGNPFEAVMQLATSYPIVANLDMDKKIISVERAIEKRIADRKVEEVEEICLEKKTTWLRPVTSMAHAERKTIDVLIPGTLSTLLTQAQKDTCTRLTVCGKLNSADIRVLRHMAGYKEKGCSTGKLRILNLAEAGFVTDKEPYMVLDAAEIDLAATAVLTRRSSYTHTMGESLFNSHNRDPYRFRHEGWGDYSNYKWIGNFYVFRSELMTVSGTSETYRPQYYIGRTSDRKMHISDICLYRNYTDRGGGYSYESSSSNVGQYFFGSGRFNERDWDMMKKRHITRFKGHEVMQDGYGYVLEVCSHKNFLPHDMFYGCPNLQYVILPIGMEVDETIIDETSKVKFLLPKDKITLLYIANKIRKGTYRPADLKSRKNIKKKILMGDDTNQLTEALGNLTPVLLSAKYNMDATAMILIEYADDQRSTEEYYLDVNRKYILDVNRRTYCKTNQALLNIIDSLGIPNKFIKVKNKNY